MKSEVLEESATLSNSAAVWSLKQQWKSHSGDGERQVFLLIFTNLLNDFECMINLSLYSKFFIIYEIVVLQNFNKFPAPGVVVLGMDLEYHTGFHNPQILYGRITQSF